MNRLLWTICLCLVMIAPAACARPQGTTRADYGRISELRIKYKGDYVFKKKEATLLVFKMTPGPADDAVTEQMFREFFYDLKGRLRRDSAVKDLKLFDAEGHYLYGLRQVWWKGKIEWLGRDQ